MLVGHCWYRSSTFWPPHTPHIREYILSGFLFSVLSFAYSLLVCFAFSLFSALLHGFFFARSRRSHCDSFLAWLCCGVLDWKSGLSTFLDTSHFKAWRKGCCWLSFKLRRKERIGSESSVATIFWLLPLEVGSFDWFMALDWVLPGNLMAVFIVFYLGIWDGREEVI